MAVLTVQSASRAAAPAELTFVGANSGGDEFVNTGREAVLIRTSDSNPKTLTIDTPGTVDGDLAIANRQVTVPAGSLGVPKPVLVGPFPRSTYNDANDKVKLSYSDVTGLTVAIVRIN